MNKTNIQAAFTFCANHLVHDEITKKMNVFPNYIRYSNEILNNGRLFGRDEWGIETKFEESMNTEDQLSKILTILFDKSEIIKVICSQYNAKCSFLITVNVENNMFPALYINPKFARFAGSINAEIGFDII